MRFRHSDFEFEFDEKWWAAAGMEGWKPTTRSYLADSQKFVDIKEVAMDEIAPVRRHLSNGVFNNDAETGLSARDRVIRILVGFREGALIPPVEVIRNSVDAPQAYSLYHGAHRFYTSMAAGFTHVPTVEKFKIP